MKRLINIPFVTGTLFVLLILGAGAYFFVSNLNFCASQDAGVTSKNAVLLILDTFERFQNKKDLTSASGCLSEPLRTSFVAQADPFPFAKVSYSPQALSRISDEKYVVFVLEKRSIKTGNIGGGTYVEEIKEVPFTLEKQADGRWLITSFTGIGEAEYGVSSPVDVQITPGISLSSEPSVEVTRVDLPKIYISYVNLPPSQWGMRGENFLYPIPPLKSGGTGSIVVTFQYENLLPPPGEYYIEVYAEPNMDPVVRSKNFNVGEP